MNNKMTQSIIIAFISAICLESCFPSFTSKDDRTIIKKFKHNNTQITWYTFNAAFAMSPNFLIISDGNATDTICISTNLAEVKDTGNMIVVGFYGKPKKYEDLIEIRAEALGNVVFVDTSFKYKDMYYNKKK